MGPYLLVIGEAQVASTIAIRSEPLVIGDRTFRFMCTGSREGPLGARGNPIR